MIERKDLILGFAALGLGTAAAPSAAAAYPRLDFWHLASSGETDQNQNRAGADGIYGTGGPFEFGIQCAHCHIASEGLISGTTFLYGDCHAILFSGGDDVTQWVFQWEAPAAGAGEVTMWYGGVDDDTGGHSSLDDDLIQGSLLLREGN